MQREYNDRINYVKNSIEKKDKLNVLLKQTEQDMIREKLLLNKLSDELEREDALKIKSSNLTSLFYAILGTGDEKLNKKKQDILKSRLKYDQCKNNVSFLSKESKRIVDELAPLKSFEFEYEKLINKNSVATNVENNGKVEELKKLIKRKESMRANILKIDESIKAGEEALRAIENTINELENSRDCGIDIIRSKENSDVKVFRDAHIDKAGYYAGETQRSLGKFKREMSDIIMITGNDIPIGTFENFSDYFFDSLIFDWVIQCEIGESLDVVKNAKNQIDKAMSKLYEERVTEVFMIKQLDDKLNHMIQNSWYYGQKSMSFFKTYR